MGNKKNNWKDPMTDGEVELTRDFIMHLHDFYKKHGHNRFTQGIIVDAIWNTTRYYGEFRNLFVSRDAKKVLGEFSNPSELVRQTSKNCPGGVRKDHMKPANEFVKDFERSDFSRKDVEGWLADSMIAVITKDEDDRLRKLGYRDNRPDIAAAYTSAEIILEKVNDDGEERRETGKSALLIIDPQNDFVDPNGKLPIGGAAHVLPAIRELMERPFDFKVITQDWHPKGHVSFASTHGTAPFVEKMTWQGEKNGIKTIKQKMWPDHCEIGGWGAEICPEIDGKLAHAVWKKGTDPTRENYSVFEYASDWEGERLILRPEDQTEYYRLMAGNVYDDFYICGFALDYCVLQTALSARSLGNVYVIEDACAAVDESKRGEVLERMRAAGIHVMTTLE